MVPGIPMTVFLLAMMMMTVTVPCSGFTAFRAVNILATGNAMPTLGFQQKATLDQAFSVKADATKTDKEWEIFDTKSTKSLEQASAADGIHGKKFDLVSENLEDGARLTKIRDSNFIMEKMDSNGTSSPRNIIVIIAEPGQDQENSLKSGKHIHPFTVVEGMLQSWGNNRSDDAELSLNESSIPGNEKKKHDCERLLRSNIVSLLLWARDVKGMTTGTLSNGNFTIPSLFGYEESIGLPKEFDEIDENGMKPMIVKSKADVREDLHPIEPGKRSSRESRSLASNREERNLGSEDALKGTLDAYAKIRLLMFLSLLKSLSGSVLVGAEDSIYRKSHAPRSTLLDVVDELKSVENEKGFVLVASISTAELNSAMESLQREVAAENTLLVASNVCSSDAEPVPFFAMGPSSKMIQEARKIWNLPIVVRNIIANGCQDSNRANSHHDVPAASNDSPMPLLKRQSRNVTQETVEEKKVDTSIVKKEVKTVEAAIAKEVEAKTPGPAGKSTSPRNNSGSTKITETWSTIIGAIASATLAFILAF